MINKKQTKTLFIPLGGCSEIGMNMYLYGIRSGKKTEYIMVDAGITFPDPECSPGVEVIMPDTTFVEDNLENVKAIFITHAHEDHIGALAHIFEYIQAPVYCRKFTALIAKAKIDRGGGDTNLVKVAQPYPKMVKAGLFNVGFFSMPHSIPEASGLVIDTPCGRIFHSGDFKIDKSPVLGESFNSKALADLGKTGVMALICDSTNVFSKHSGRSESPLLDNFIKLFEKTEGMIVATTFASNLARLKTLASAAQQTERSLVILGRAMNNMIAIGHQSGVLKGFPQVISPRDAKTIPRKKLLVLASGSQGEPRAASAHLARDGYMGLTIQEGDKFLFSSKTIPGNELRVARIIDKLVRRGVEVIEDIEGLYHVSGHANEPDLTRIHKLVNPDVLIPMHGEYRHLREHAKLAERSGIKSLVVTNGQVAEITPNAGTVITNEVTSGRVFLDGSFLVDEDEGIISDRIKLMNKGHVVISVLVTGSSPYFSFELTSLGVPTLDDSKSRLIAELELGFDTFLNNSKVSSITKITNENIESESRRFLNKFFKAELGKKPLISVCIHRDDHSG